MRLILLALLGLVGARPAWAETTHCTTITSLPATITAQGVYCLKQDLVTGISAGAGVTVTTNNVTLDCNGHKIGGLAGGAGSQATGVLASNRSNVTVRNCNVRGFRVGIALTSTGSAVPNGLVVEDNRIGAAAFAGVMVSGHGSLVRGNTLAGIGGVAGPLGIASRYGVDVIDNTLDGLSGLDFPVAAIAIRARDAEGAVIERNRLRHLAGSQPVVGIQLATSAANVLVRRNVLGASGGSVAVQCVNPLVVARGNVAFGFAQVHAGCVDGGQNLAGGATP